MKLGVIFQKKNLRTIFLVLSILLGFIFIVLFSSLYVSDAIRNNDACGCVIPIPFMILLLSSLGLFIGFLSFYVLMSQRIQEQKDISTLTALALRFLESDERAIMRVLIVEQQPVLQSVLESKTGLHKVRIYRALEKLLARGVITKTAKGRMNVVSLADAYVGMLLS